MKRIFFYIAILVLFSCSSSDESNNQNNDPTVNTFYKGMDLSFQSELENYNVTYKDESGNPVDLLDFVSQNGTNLVRLKLWHTPVNGQNSLEDVKAYAVRIKSRGMDFLLNFHYSDFWADPGHQSPPAAWQNMSVDEVKTEIYNYTKDVVLQLKAQGTLPQIIQVGNETDNGFLWNYGKVWNEFSDNWPNYADLTKEAIRAIREVDTNNEVQIMLHISNVESAVSFFNQLEPFNLDYDIIGLSYYPKWHTKDLGAVRSALYTIAITFNKDIMLVEVSYPFTFQWNDNSNNIIGGQEEILTEFAATPEGQKAYFEWVVTTLKSIPNNRGIGFCYWAPDWVAFEGNNSTSTSGSAWENQCMFDFEFKALPVFDVYRSN
ncbi:MAG: glycosyl hydrolase 53 family protein [Psychroserpens sp.]|nr:glycosyl hydrolase 53 family protein [Psychroserpens sp.]